jgi:hypothetical protein
MSSFCALHVVAPTNATCFRADGALIDDPVRSREDADSERIRDKTWDWYFGVGLVFFTLLDARAGLWREKSHVSDRRADFAGRVSAA